VEITSCTAVFFNPSGTINHGFKTHFLMSIYEIIAEYCISSVNPAGIYEIIGHHQSLSPFANNYRNFVYQPHSIYKKSF